MRLWRPANPERRPDGLPVSSLLEQRVALAIVLVASVWFALAAAWELFGPILAGHYAASASIGIMAENMLHWHIAGPVWEYTASKPPPSAYYCHHPWGIFWTEAVFVKLLGRHDYVCRLPAVLLSSATPPLLYALGRAMWRPAAGAIAAAAFVVLPISLAFASFNALEVPVIAWSLLGLWAFVRHTQLGRRRHLALSVLGFTLALHADWPAFVLVAELLGFGLFRGVLLRRWPFGRVQVRPYAQWWALLATSAALTALLYVYLFHKAGALDELLNSYKMRSAGGEQPLWMVLGARRYWLELSFTPIAFVLGALAVGVCVLRLIVRRYEHEILPLAFFGMAAVQYVVFKQGADIHIFWPQYFARYFALGMGALAATGIGLGEWLAQRWRRRHGQPSGREPMVPLLAVLAALLLPLVAILRDGLPALVYAHGTGGRFNEKGLLIDSDGAKTAFLRWLEPSLPPRAVIGIHESMKATWAQVWALGGRVVRPGRPPPGPAAGEDVYLADTHFMPDDLQDRLAAEHHVTAVGPFWSYWRTEAAAPIDAFAIVEREPSLWQWYFQSGTEPVRTIVPDPFLTWELRTHFGQPAELPTVEPEGFEQQRIAFNIAKASGDEARAAALWAGLRAQLQGPSAIFEEGTELVGCRFSRGVEPMLTLLLRAKGPADDELELHVRSRVLERAPWSTTMPDPAVREVAQPLSLSPKRWRAGWLYSHPVVIRKRPGTEVFDVALSPRRGSGRPKPGAHGRPVEVLRLR